MCVVKPPGELNRNIEDSFKDILFASLIEAAVGDPVLEGAVRNILGENSGDPADPAEEIAGDHIGMQSQIHPGLAFPFERQLSVFGKDEGGFRAFNGKVDIPFLVVNTVNHSNPPFRVRDAGSQFKHLIFLSEKEIARFPDAELISFGPVPIRVAKTQLACNCCDPLIRVISGMGDI